MKDDDLIKAPLSPYGNNTLKIKYIEQNYSSAELLLLTLFFIFLIPDITFIIYQIVSVTNGTATSINLPPTLITAFTSLILPIIVFVFYLIARKKRISRQKAEMEAVTSGQKVTGTVKQVIDVVRRTSKGGEVHEYYYAVEFENPINRTIQTYKTPQVSNGALIRNSDLPLQATVYVKDSTIYVDEILNPPVEKIGRRKRINLIFVLYTCVAIVAMCILVAFGLTPISMIVFFSLIPATFIYRMADKKTEDTNQQV